MTLSECRSELHSIMNELNDTMYSLRNDSSIKGIGEDICSLSIELVINEYEHVLQRLNRIDYKRLASWMEEIQEG